MGIFDKKEEETKEAEAAVKDAKVTDVKQEDKKEEIILALVPVITEKAHNLASSGKYVFRVAKKSTKKGIAREVKKQHSVDVESVNIVNQPRKRRSVGRNRGYQQSYKKAIVTVKKGQHIAAFETA